MPRQVLRGPQRQLDTGGAADDTHRLERVPGLNRPAGTPRTRGSRRPVSTTPTCCGWCGSDASSTAISSSVGLRSFGMRSTARVSEVGSTTWAIAKSPTSTAPRDTLRPKASSSPGSSVVASCGRSASSGLSTCVRCGGVVGGQAPLVEHSRREERRRQDLHIAVERQGFSDGSAALLDRAEPAPGRRQRQHRRNDLEALQPQHLFDEVGGLAQVGPPARRGRRHPARRSPRRHRSGSACVAWCRRLVDACGAVGQIDGHADRRVRPVIARRITTPVGERGFDCAASDSANSAAQRSSAATDIAGSTVRS